jgi:hypothetical protein
MLQTTCDSARTPTSIRLPLPLVALRILLTGVATWMVCALYAFFLNPELAFFKHGYYVKQDWVRKMRRSYGTNIVIFGGSSCMAGVDSVYAEKTFSIPLINNGFGAGLGSHMLAQTTLKDLREGDTLIVALEPGLLMNSSEVPSLGVQFSFVTGQFGSLLRSQSISTASAFLALRPGAYHCFTLLGKIVLGQSLYRYAKDDFQEGGLLAIRERRPFSDPPVGPHHLSDDGKKLLHDLSGWCQGHSVRVAYTLPWMFYPPEHAAQMRKEFGKFLDEANIFLPILRDPIMGCYPIKEDFADSPLHLVPKAAQKHTDELARHILAWDVDLQGTRETAHQ